MSRHIPNVITLLNLFVGIWVSVSVINHDPTLAGWLLVLALGLDFSDGMAARLLHVVSPIGKELDSLADVISFGLTPGILMADLIASAQGMSFPAQALSLSPFAWAWAGGVITVFSALRLALFNLDERQQEVFFGVPTPGNTALMMSLWLIVQLHPGSAVATLLQSLPFLLGLTALLCWLLVAEIRLVALKFKTFGWAENWYRYAMIGIGLSSMALFQYRAVPILFVGYLIASAVERYFVRKKDPSV
ncbi:MAG: CDP-alcohol phosphatidyltransferase family protein [Bacteroidia bacterium]|nr:CDP-alcohol phosphatidyltransferase family protein [Bacteroidia bacterium]